MNSFARLVGVHTTVGLILMVCNTGLQLTINHYREKHHRKEMERRLLEDQNGGRRNG